VFRRLLCKDSRQRFCYDPPLVFLRYSGPTVTPTRIKICGITRPEDAALAIRSGADALGLVFYPESPRAVSVAQARRIAAVVPPFVTLVALFVDASRETISSVLQEVPIGMIQFHGNETPAFCGAFRLPWMKAIRVREGLDVSAACRPYRDASGVLLDAWQDGVPGGTGQTFDWQQAEAALPLPVVLAGGLNAGNVAEAINTLRPWAVDVSGGVESSPGVKDGNRIEQFIAAVRTADQQQLEEQ